MTLRRSFHSIITNAVIWEILGRLGPCFFVVALVFTPSAPFICRMQAQTLPAEATTSNATKQSQGNEAAAIPSAPSAGQAIPLPQIADRAEQLDRLTKEIHDQLTPKAELMEVERKTEAQAAETRRRAMQTRDLLAGNPTSLYLEDELRFWRSRSLEYAAERRLLTQRARRLEEQIQTLEDQQREWIATWIQFQKTPGIETILERIRQQLDKIQAAKSEAQEQLSLVLSVQNQVSQQDQQISDLLLRVREAREQ